MICATCHGETPSGKPFCANCGAPLAPHCPSCGLELLVGKPFCANCGAAVVASVGAPKESTRSVGERLASRDEPTVTAERRLCSVLFVDLVGFTSMAESRDPEHVREILSEYFDRAQGIVTRYGGTVEKFIGDAVMAVWGAPVANEDDAERAVRAALEVVASVSQLGESAGLAGLRARGGVVTGEVAITVGKVSEGMVLGDTVNSASRVQSVAEPGSVLVDESTWRAASGAIAFEEVGELELKGKAVTIQAWRALRVVAQRKGIGRSERLEPPFVGREEEIRLIRDLLHVTGREQRARLVSVMGIPGIGKSRLAWEFLKYIDGLAEDVFWHQGRSRAYGEGIAFGALSEMVRARANILEGDEPTSAAQKLRECLEEFIPDAAERQWIEPRLAHLLSLVEAPTNDREELFSAWRTFFERIADRAVTVLVFEDLQWADAGLIDFVESILEWSKNLPIMVVTLARPELIERRVSWGAGVRNFTSLHLDPLSSEAMRDMLDGFVHGLPEDVMTSVLERAVGVPLYAVETIRMLVDRGVIAQSADGYEVRGEFGVLEIPETLHALIASRLDALPARQRALLQDAGVVGSTFSLESLSVVSGVAREALESDLRDLVRKEYIVVDNDPRSTERGQYGFVQGVIREVAVGTLARRDRQAKHLAIASYAESLHDDELAAIVAAHYLEAYRATPEEADSDYLIPKALEWLQRAGDRAMSLGSPEQAAHSFLQALELARDPSARAALCQRVSDAQSRLQEYAQAVSFLDEAASIYDQLGDVNSWGLVIAAQAQSMRFLGRSGEAAELCQGAFERVRDNGEVRVCAQLSGALGELLAIGQDLTLALEWCERALAFAEELDDSQLLASALGSRSLALFTLGRHREAVMLARGMAAIADEAGDLLEAARSRTGLSLYMLPDDPLATVRIATEAVDLSRRAGQRSMEITNLLNIAETSLNLGQWDHTRKAFAELRQRELVPWHVEWLCGLEAIMASMEGANERADELLLEGVEAFKALDAEEDTMLSSQTTKLTTRGFIALARGDFDASYRDAHRAIALDPVGINSGAAMIIAARAALWLRDVDKLREVHDATTRLRGRFIAAHRRSCEAGIAALEDRLDDAVETYRDVIEQWRALDCVLEIGQCELDVVMLLGPTNVDSFMVKEAREIFERLGAAVLIERLDSASGNSPSGDVLDQ